MYTSISHALEGKGTAGIYVGRFCPMHKGHQALIQAIIDAYGDKHLILVGSCNHDTSIRHLFSYNERVSFIKKIFPDVRIAPLADFPGDDASWFEALDHLIKLAGFNPQTVAYVGGCEEDVQFYYQAGRNVHIVNRFSGITVNISGQQIRDALIHERPQIKDFLDAQIIDMVKKCFAPRWNEMRNK